ncbi:hypothetical protein EIP91_001374 [Steccherinum ochraceum]|uniref:NAD(P)-binding protein n=1 Tax=Steccherinum ochraceum TaxID=92696 RepID=A0A4R0RRH4_9APHY|nr:hypothetical protein EIP91_001374 [Steccherinum ochraceum]
MPSYVVTGTNRGLGFEFVKQLSSKPENIVFATVRNPAASKDLFALQTNRKNVHVLEADLTKPTSWKDAAIAVTKVTGGTLDVLINNAAGLALPGPAIDAYGEGQEAKVTSDYVDSFQINVIGTIHATNAFLPLILTASKTNKNFTPKVITLNTGATDVKFFPKTGLETVGPYIVAKAALAAVTAQYASTHYLDNVIFLTISPAFANNNIESASKEGLKEFEKIIAGFKRAAPHWDGVPITVEESISSMLTVFDKLTKEQSGAFISHKGNQEWL